MKAPSAPSVRSVRPASSVLSARSVSVRLLSSLCALVAIAAPTVASGQVNDAAATSDRFQYLDVFDLEVAADPQISPDGSRIVYVRRGFDIMTDGGRTALWALGSDGSDHRALTDGNSSVSSPRWSPDGNRLLYVSSEGGSSQIFVRWMDSGQVAELTNVTESPGGITWSPDGESIAMTMFVSEPPPTFARMPARPEGAEWNEAPMRHRRDLRRRRRHLPGRPIGDCRHRVQSRRRRLRHRRDLQRRRNRLSRRRAGKRSDGLPCL